MDRLGELKSVALRQNLEGELPSWLLAEVLTIADDPERYGEADPLIEILIGQIRDYDPYAGAGCFSDSVGISMIEATLCQIKRA